MKLTAQLFPDELELLRQCRDAGQFGAVVARDTKVAMTFAGMSLIEEVAPNAFSITQHGSRALAEQDQP